MVCLGVHIDSFLGHLLHLYVLQTFFFLLGQGLTAQAGLDQHNPISSAPYMLGLQVCTSIPTLNIRTFTCPFCLNKTILKDSIHEMCIQFKRILN